MIKRGALAGQACLAATLAIMATTSVPSAAQDSGPSTLTDTERHIVRTIERNRSKALDLLERAVNINSGTMNFAGVREVGRLFAQEFERFGFEVEWLDGERWGRSGHLIASRPGTTGPHVLLIGHLDTVFEPDSPFQQFEMINDSTAAGPGAIDMKGGIVVMLQALNALHEENVLDDLQVTVVLHGDEEKSGSPLSLARQALIDVAREADIAIGFEDGDGDPRTAVIARRGWTGWTLTVTSRTAHSSQIFQPDVGAGAAYELSRILNTFYADLSGEEFLTFNAGVVFAGSNVEFDPDEDRGNAFGKSNVIPETALASGDLRTIDEAQRERAKERMRAIVGDHLPHTSAEITFEDTYPPMAPTDGNRELLALYDEISQSLGLGPVSAVNPQNAGAADVSFTAGHVEMAIDGLGMMGTGGHTVNETADLRTLQSQSSRAALLLLRLAKWRQTQR